MDWKNPLGAFCAYWNARHDAISYGTSTLSILDVLSTLAPHNDKTLYKTWFFSTFGMNKKWRTVMHVCIDLEDTITWQGAGAVAHQSAGSRQGVDWCGVAERKLSTCKLRGCHSLSIAICRTSDLTVTITIRVPCSRVWWSLAAVPTLPCLSPASSEVFSAEISLRSRTENYLF